MMLEQLCYDVAYFILPEYAYRNLPRIVDLCLNNPAAGPFVYFLACSMRKTEPNSEAAILFRWHHDQLGIGRDYFVLEYPTPPPVDMSGLSPDELTRGQFVLAPHFSAIFAR